MDVFQNWVKQSGSSKLVRKVGQQGFDMNEI